MAHNITIGKDGKAEMFYTGQKPWHELGTEVPSALTSAEAIATAGLDWEVKRAPVRFSPDGFEDMREVDSKFVNYRSDTGSPLGVVGPDYTVVQNRDAFKFFDAVVGEKAAMYHTAGSLLGGKKIWLLAKLPQDIVVKGVDISKNYLLLSNSHDGSQALRVLWTTVRVVCNNTLTAAMRGAEGKVSALRHTTNIGMRVQQVQEFLGLASGLTNRFNLKANELASKPLSYTVVEDFFSRMGLSVIAADSERTKTMKKNTMEAINDLIEKTGKVTPEIAGTRWALLNAYTDFVDHDRSVRPSYTADKWADSILFGSAAESKRKALSELLVI